MGLGEEEKYYEYEVSAFSPPTHAIARPLEKQKEK